jgi:hypothetical protein
MKNLHSLFIAVVSVGLLLSPVSSQARTNETGEFNYYSPATPALTQTSESVSLTPSQGVPGKSYAIAISSKDCKIDFKKGKYKFDETTAPGITINGESFSSDSCTVSATLVVDANAAIGPVILRLKPETGDPVIVTFNVVAVPPNPIPPGLDPQVDVMWVLVPQNVVKDNFGRRFGKIFYCIEIVIGNNTGYDLQIASVGFRVGPIGKAASVMSNTLQDVATQTTMARESWKAAAEAQSQAVRDEAQAAIDKAYADQLESKGAAGKDKAKADAEASAGRAALSRIRANQLQKAADTTAAAQEGLVNAARAQADSLTRLSQLAFNQTLPVSSYTMTRGSVEHGQFWDMRNLSLNFIRSLGPVLTGFTPYFRAINRQRNYSNAIDIFSNPFEKGFQIAFPDETIRQLQRLDDQILRDGVIIPNNRQYRTRAFIPKELLGLEKKLKDDPLVVTQALGTLVLIGDKIQFVNRVSVSSAPSGEIKPPPTVNPIQRTYKQKKAGETGEPLNLTGTNLDDATLASSDPNRVSVSNVSGNSTSLRATVTVAEQAEPGTYALTVSTPRGSVPVAITVVQVPPEVTSSNNIPTFKDNVTPASNPTEDKDYFITVQGHFLKNVTLSPVKHPTKGVALQIKSGPNVNADGTSFDAVVTVPKETPPDTYEIEVKNNSPESYTAPRLKIVVGRQEAAAVKQDTLLYGPNKLKEEPTENPLVPQEVPIIISGSNLNGATLTLAPDSTGKGVTIKDPGVLNKESGTLTATIVIDKMAKADGYNFQIKNTNDVAAPATFKFTLKGQPPPVINDPVYQKPKAAQAAEQTVDVSLTGTNLQGAVVDDTKLPTGWRVTKAESGADGKTLNLTLKIPANTAAGVSTLEIKTRNATPAKFPIEVVAP